jgi:hypothetical protein
MFIESKLVGVVVIRHGLLSYPNPFQPSVSLYLWLSQGCITIKTISKQEVNGVKGTNVGLMKTIGEGTECPGISSNQMTMIRSLLELH